MCWEYGGERERERERVGSTNRPERERKVQAEKFSLWDLSSIKFGLISDSCTAPRLALVIGSSRFALWNVDSSKSWHSTWTMKWRYRHQHLTLILLHSHCLSHSRGLNAPSLPSLASRLERISIWHVQHMVHDVAKCRSLVLIWFWNTTIFFLKK